ncbi:hypothetical protein BDD12DRAFT_46980 [Trichophaea hybrida]|nr:hypothetical protein BDD12DRAFT_46980 [Trichophaea hybrida]
MKKGVYIGQLHVTKDLGYSLFSIFGFFVAGWIFGWMRGSFYTVDIFAVTFERLSVYVCVCSVPSHLRLFILAILKYLSCLLV